MIYWRSVLAILILIAVPSISHAANHWVHQYGTAANYRRGDVLIRFIFTILLLLLPSLAWAVEPIDWSMVPDI